MGSTACTNRKALAFRASNNQIGYVLLDQTYEKNVDPCTPRWCVRSFGNIEDTLSCIFGDAAAVESGSFQVSGCSTATSFIASWLELLETPYAFNPEGQYTLKFGGWGASLPTKDIFDKDLKEPILNALREAGFSSQAETLAQDNGQLAVTLTQDFNLLRTIYGSSKKRLVAPWKLLGEYLSTEGLNSDLGYKPAKAGTKTSWQPPMIYRAPEHAKSNPGSTCLLVQTDDGKFVSSGWPYQVIGNHLANSWQDELRTPGSYHFSVAAMHKAINKSVEVPDSTVIQFTLNHLVGDDKNHYETSEITKIAKKLGKTGTEFTVTWGEVKKQGEAQYQVSRSKAARWVVPQKVSKTETSVQDLFNEVFA